MNAVVNNTPGVCGALTLKGVDFLKGTEDALHKEFVPLKKAYLKAWSDEDKRKKSAASKGEQRRKNKRAMIGRQIYWIGFGLYTPLSLKICVANYYGQRVLRMLKTRRRLTMGALMARRLCVLGCCLLTWCFNARDGREWWGANT